MCRFSVWAVGLLTAAAVIGCGPGKELPDDVPGPKVAGGPAPDPLGPAPERSDPAAKAVLERAVKAVTENVPGGREKAKVSKVVYKGVMNRPSSGGMTKTERTIEAVWPDRALAVNTFKDERLELPSEAVAFYLSGGQAWMRHGLEVDQRIPPSDLARVVRTDITAQYWLILGLPFDRPEAVAFDLTKSETATTVKVGLPNMPVLRVGFDQKSGLPVEVDYYPVESQQRPHKVLKLGDHKPAGGFMLPGTIELFQNDTPAERFAVVSWEFPKEIDPARFDPHKP